MTDYKALCAELVDIVTAHCNPDDYAVGYCAAVLTRARTALAEGDGVAVTDEELDEVFFKHCLTEDFANDYVDCVGFREVARAMLKRYGTTHPRPIPVAERLPTAADCDSGGQCWWYSPAKGECKTDSWEFAASAAIGDTHWLPAAAIPLPEVGS
jgi:hypothetical protein